MNIKDYIVKNKTMEFLLLLTVSVTGILLWIFFSSENVLTSMVAFFNIYALKNQILAGIIFLFFVILSVLLGPLTSTPIVPAALFLWDRWITFGLLITGWLIGGMTAYAIGKFIGYPLVARILSKEKVDKWQKFVLKETTFLLAFIFRLIMPAETGYIFGLVGYNFLDYFLITLLVELPIAAVLIWASDALLSRDFLQFIFLIGGTAIIFGILGYVFRKKINSK